MGWVSDFWCSLIAWWRQATRETWLVAGVLLGVGLITPLWWMTWLGVLLFIAAAVQAPNRRFAMWGGYLAFSFKALFALAWFWSTYPLDWLVSLSPLMQIFSIGFYWVTTALALGAGGALAGWGIWKIHQWYRSGIWFVSLVTVIWLIAEVVGSFVFSVVLWGVGGGFNLQFGLGYVGYVLAEHPLLLQFAMFGGVYGLTALAVVTASSVYTLFQGNSRVRPAAITAGVLVAIFVVTAFLHTNRPEVDNAVAVVHTDFKADSLADETAFRARMKELQAGVRAAIEVGAEYVVLPEDARLTVPFGGSNETLKWLREQAGQQEIVIIDSTRVNQPDGTAILRGFIYDTAAGRVWHTDKQYLVPQGEFMPYLHDFILRNFLGPDAVDQIADQVSYRPGVRNVEMPAHIPGVLFCFASIDPLGVERLVDERGVGWVAHPVSHAWFVGTPDGLWQQLRRMVRVHEEWQGLPVVTAANEGDPHLWTGKEVIHESERVRVVWE